MRPFFVEIFKVILVNCKSCFISYSDLYSNKQQLHRLFLIFTEVSDAYHINGGVGGCGRSSHYGRLPPYAFNDPIEFTSIDLFYWIVLPAKHHRSVASLSGHEVIRCGLSSLRVVF